jgi:hypothetical protein
VRSPPGESQTWQENWTADRVISVTGGQMQFIGVYIFREAGSATANCSGTLVVEAIF